jgi:hypothetical protein
MVPAEEGGVPELVTATFEDAAAESLPFTDDAVALQRRPLLGVEPVSVAFVSGGSLALYDSSGQVIPVRWGETSGDSAYKGFLSAQSPEVRSSGDGLLLASVDRC